jgi:hypothetical protein
MRVDGRPLSLVLALAGCGDALDQRLAIITEPRLLAVVSDPAEAKPGATETYTALIAGPDGPVTDAPAWAYCTAPKPPTEDNAVSAGCLGDAVMALGTADAVMGALPADGCAQFGPDTPPGGFRPRDPDPTGGFYQPVRVSDGDVVGFGLSRITCNLGSAPTSVARDYQLHYQANVNPTLLPATVADAPANSDVTMTAAWPANAVETYLYFDQGEQVLVVRREAMRVSWYATAGTLPVDASEVGEDDPATSVSTTWHTPGPGTAWLWLVLRDSRGGIATQQLEVTVR